MKVLLIKPPYMETSRPDYPMVDTMYAGVRYMSPALILLSEMFSGRGVDNSILVVSSIKTLHEELPECMVSNPVFACITCTSAWEYLESLEIARYVHLRNPKSIVAIGGWQIKSIGTKVFEDCEDIDYAVVGNSIEEIFNLYQYANDKCDWQVKGVYYRNNFSLFSPEVISKDPLRSCYDFSVYPN